MIHHPDLASCLMSSSRQLGNDITQGNKYQRVQERCMMAWRPQGAESKGSLATLIRAGHPHGSRPRLLPPPNGLTACPSPRPNLIPASLSRNRPAARISANSDGNRSEPSSSILIVTPAPLHAHARCRQDLPFSATVAVGGSPSPETGPLSPPCYIGH